MKHSNGLEDQYTPRRGLSQHHKSNLNCPHMPPIGPIIQRGRYTAGSMNASRPPPKPGQAINLVIQHQTFGPVSVVNKRIIMFYENHQSGAKGGRRASGVSSKLTSAVSIRFIGVNVSL